MHMHFRRVVVLISLSLASLISAHDFDSSHYLSQNVITRDFCIIGGGSSGTYAAIRLHDMGKRVVVVERKDRLGGHTQTYIDPATKTPIDIGVINWNNLDVVKEYLARLNVAYTLTNNSLPGITTVFANLKSGKLSTYEPPDPTAALTAYAAQLEKYPYLRYGFNLPSPVPEDLLLPLGQFVTKYALEDLVFLIASYAEGLGDILRQPTLYIMKLIGLDLLQTLQSGFIVTSSNDNSEVYEKAHAILGSDSLLRTHVVAMDRGNDNNASYVKIIVENSNGDKKLINAKNIIISIPPKLRNLVGFDLSAKERNLFAQFGNSAYYTGLIRDSGIASDKLIINVNGKNAYDLPQPPSPYGFYPRPVPTLTAVFYGSAVALPDEYVKKRILSSLFRLREGNGNITTATTGNVTAPSPSFAVFSGHVPFELTVSTRAIEGGFYGALYGLQGQRRTYYTGAAFHVQDSALLWRFTEGLLTTMLG